MALCTMSPALPEEMPGLAGFMRLPRWQAGQNYKRRIPAAEEPAPDPGGGSGDGRPRLHRTTHQLGRAVTSASLDTSNLANNRLSGNVTAYRQAENYRF